MQDLCWMEDRSVGENFHNDSHRELFGKIGLVVGGIWLRSTARHHVKDWMHYCTVGGMTARVLLALNGDPCG